MAVCGLDVAKDSLDYAAGSLRGTVANSVEGIQELYEVLQLHNVELVVMEASGGYQDLACRELAERGVVVAVENPSRVHAFGQALGQFAKTDRIDAAILARYGEVMDCRPWSQPSPEQQRLRELVRRRAQLVADKTREYNRKKQAGQRAADSIAIVLKALKAEVQRIEKLIRKELKTGALRALADRLMGIPGVGPIVAASLISEMPELGALTSRQAGALAGVVPYAKDSGKYSGIRKRRGGRPRLRHALYMAVLVGIRFNPAIKAHYHHLLSRGKQKKVAMVACMNKLTGWLNAMTRDQLDWCELEVAKI